MSRPGESYGVLDIKIGTIQKRLAWPMRKDDTQISEEFNIVVFMQQKCLEFIL